MSILSIVLRFLVGLQLVQATIYVTAPGQGSTCRGGQSCLVQWLEDGEFPSLTAIRACHVGLYNGNDVLVQQIEPVNVATVRSLRFTPDPSAGPDSSLYYINFTSVDLIGNPPQHYTQYSPFFKLEGMAGSFNKPVPSDTSTLPVPNSVASPPPETVTSTVFVSSSSMSSNSTTTTTTLLNSSRLASSATSTSITLPSSTMTTSLSSLSATSPASSSSTSLASTAGSSDSSTSGFVTSRSPFTGASSTANTSAGPSSTIAASATSAARRSCSSSFGSFALHAVLAVGITVAMAL